MEPDSEKTCHCHSDEPVILQGSLPESPLNCMQCKNPVSLEGTNVSGELAEAINKWGRIHSSLFTLWRDSGEYREWAKQILLDEIGSINLKGLKLAQQYNVIRKTYYWLFQDISDKDYVQPQRCPFCGASMEPILKNDFKVCHDCRVAYPDKQTS
jgi:hypothetical protein